jgi:hypothetical protein
MAIAKPHPSAPVASSSGVPARSEQAIIGPSVGAAKAVKAARWPAALDAAPATMPITTAATKSRPGVPTRPSTTSSSAPQHSPFPSAPSTKRRAHVAGVARSGRDRRSHHQATRSAATPQSAASQPRTRSHPASAPSTPATTAPFTTTVAWATGRRW